MHERAARAQLAPPGAGTGGAPAENVGERDVLGNQYGGDGPKTFPGVTVLGWEQVGNYALRFDFSDGHRTGLYHYDFLRRLGT